jgi:Ribonuclease G/E
MPIDEVLISSLPGDRRAAARCRGVLVDLVFDTGTDDAVRVGDVRLGRVVALAPALGAAFVDVGAARPGLLMQADAPAGQPLGEGETIVVLVTRAPEAEKGVKLGAPLPRRIAAAGDRPAPCLIEAGADPIVALLRSVAGPALRRVVVDDAGLITAARTAVPAVSDVLQYWREATPLFAAEGIDEAIDAALASEVPLPSGGRLHIEETAALVAIDVDSGSTGGASARAAALACDLEAASEIGRQIRLRDLAGLIVVDFVPLRRPAERARVLDALCQSLADDDRQPRIGGWTRLGLLEMVRRRHGPSVRRRLLAPCPSCTGGGTVRAPRWVAGDALRAVRSRSNDGSFANLELAVSPAVESMLRGPLAAARRDVEDRLGHPLTVTVCGTLPPDAFHLSAAERHR